MTAPHALKVSDLSSKRPTAFEIRPDATARAAIAQELGLLGLRKLSFVGEIASAGRADWRLDARLGATVVQSCVVTLEPVTTRLDEDVTRRYSPDAPESVEGVEEVEMPEDDTLEPLGRFIDPEQVMIEALSLALPLYPRAEDAEPLGEAVFAPPGQRALRDEDARPFAELAELRARLATQNGDAPRNGTEDGAGADEDGDKNKNKDDT